MRILGVALLWGFIFPCTALANSTVWVAANEESAPSQDMRAQISSEREELLLFFEEEDLIVTATKHPQTLKEVPASATIFTAEQIRDMGAESIVDVLRRVPGMAVSMEGAGMRVVEVRGIRTLVSEKVKLLIDGHSVNARQSESFGWTHDKLSIDNVKRIEVIRGPGSALYGNGAFSAIINVITKDGADIDGVIATVGRGSYNTGRMNLQAGKRFENLDIAFHVDYNTTDGNSQFIAQDVVGAEGYTEAWDRKLESGLNVSYKGLSFNFKHVKRELAPYLGAASAINDESELSTDTYFAELVFEHPVTDNLDVTAKAYIDNTDQHNTWELFPENTVPGYPSGVIGSPSAHIRAIGGELQADYRLNAGNLLTFGAVVEQIKQSDVKQETNFNPLTGAPLGSVQDISSWANWSRNVERDIWAFYIQDIWDVTDDLNITLGVRHDQYDDFGGATSPRAAIVWHIQTNWDLKLLYGEAFRAPTFNELYFMNNPSRIGNPDMDPEIMKTYEASVGYNLNTFSARLTYFNNEITNNIRQVLVPDTRAALKFENSGGVKVNGLEVEMMAELMTGLMLYTNYTYQRAEDKDTDSKLPNIADHKGNIGFNALLLGKLNVNMNVFMTGALSRASGDNREPVPGYALVDLTLILKNVYKTFEIRASAHNLFDKEYFDPSPVSTVPGDYPREGINYMLEVRYKI